jgi:hypothetical protein
MQGETNTRIIRIRQLPTPLRGGKALEPKLVMVMSLTTEVLEQPVALGASLLVVSLQSTESEGQCEGNDTLILATGCQDLLYRDIVPGSTTFSHTPKASTLNTVPGYPGIPRSFSVLYNHCQASGKEGIFRLWFFNPYRVPFA